jgi:hypothetical protein
MLFLGIVRMYVYIVCVCMDVCMLMYEYVCA